MATKRFNFQRFIGLLVLGSLLLSGVQNAFASASQQQGATSVDYPFGQGYQNTSGYISNMKLVLEHLGDGTNAWKIPAKSTASYNKDGGCFCASDGHVVVYGVIGGGACDVATWFYHVAKDSDLLSATASRLDHPKIQGVPLPAVTIWNPGSDLFVKNDNDFDVYIHWDLNANPGYIRLWVDQNAGSAVPSQNIAPNQPTPEPETEDTPETDVTTPEPEVYDPRPAQGDPVHDATQPLAPMWMKSTSVWWWRNDIYRWAKEWNLNPNIIATLIQIESGGYPLAGSSAGAMGLVQVVPKYHLNYDQGETADMLFDPDFVIEKGLLFYTKSCLPAADGDPIKAAACYNAGRGVLAKDPAYWPEETKSYVKWFSWIDDAFDGATTNKLLEQHISGCSRPGGLCTKAIEWEFSHPREDNEAAGEPVIQAYEDAPVVRVGTWGVEYDGKTIIISWAPIGWVLFFLIISGILSWAFGDTVIWRDKHGKIRQKRTGWGPKVLKATLIVVTIIYFPLNFGRIFTAMDEGIMPYNNIAFSARSGLEENTQWIDATNDIIQEVGKYLPDTWNKKITTVTKPIQTLKSIKDTWVDFFAWLGDDPVLVPVFRFISEKVQVYLIPNEILGGGNWAIAEHDFASPILPEGSIPVLRTVTDLKGHTNPWGLHGEQCYACYGLKSWLGTDMIIAKDAYVQAPMTLVIDKIILDGTDDVGGASIWMSAADVRFALVNVNVEDAKLLAVGQTVKAGQKIVRAAGPHLHVILEVRNKDGSWADYPLTYLLQTTGMQYQWLESQPPFYDTYVPTAQTVANRSDYLIKER